jgi:hypothetical protein
MNLKTFITSALLVILALNAISQVVADDSSYVKKCGGFRFNPALAFGTFIGGQITSGGLGTGTHVAFKARLNPWLNAGVGVGIERYQTESVYPLFAEITSDFSSKPNHGFFILQTGYAFSYVKAYDVFDGYKSKGGFLISPGWGYKINLKNKADFIFIAQFRNQGFRIDYTTDTGHNYTDRFTYNFLVLKTGFSF